MESTKTVGIFYNSITSIHKAPHKRLLMDNFRDGVLLNGDIVIEYTERGAPIGDIDCGFILGYTLEQNFRRAIIDELASRNIPAIFVDSNILHYSTTEHEWHRYSMNSVYPDDGVYFFDTMLDKWDYFSESNGVTLKSWQTRGNHILVLAQRATGWNLLGNDQEEWIINTVRGIQQYSARPIVVRMHPGDGNRFIQAESLKARLGDAITISDNANIREDLVNCWCTVGYNSTPNVVARIEGVPGYLYDPNKSWASDVSFTSLNQIETPMVCDRGEWLEKIANIHWSNDEVKAGKLWNAIRKYISTSRF